MADSYEHHQHDVMRTLNQRAVYLNELGLPTGIFRIDLLPFHDYSPDSPTPQAITAPPPPLPTPPTDLDSDLGPEESQPTVVVDELPIPETIDFEDQRVAGFRRRDLRNAFVQLYYGEGFPAFSTGNAFWERLPWEPMDAYLVFEQYLHLGIDGILHNKDQVTGDHTQEEHQGVRSIRTLAHRLRFRGTEESQIIVAQEQYARWSDMFYWGLRAKAYDLYRVLQHRKANELRAIQTVDKHYVLSNQLFQRLEKYMTDEEEFWELMSPKVATDLLKTLVAVQRISVGLPAMQVSGGANGGGAPAAQSQSLELTLRQIAGVVPQASGANGNTRGAQTTPHGSAHTPGGGLLYGPGGSVFDAPVGADSGGVTIDGVTGFVDASDILRQVAQSPDIMQVAQELIIRLNKGGV